MTIYIPQNPIALITSYITAICMQEMFPEAKPIEGNAEGAYFWYDFLFDKTLSSEHLARLQAKIRAYLKGELTVHISTMLSSNASLMLEKRGLEVLAKKAANYQGLISLIQIKNFYDVCPFSEIKTSFENADAILLENAYLDAYYEYLGECSIVRIEGKIVRDYQEFKQIEKSTRFENKAHFIERAKNIGWINSGKRTNTLKFQYSLQEVRNALQKYYKKQGYEETYTYNFHSFESTSRYIVPPLGFYEERDVFEKNGQQFAYMHEPSMYHTDLFLSQGEKKKQFFEIRSNCRSLAVQDEEVLVNSSNIWADYASTFCSIADIENELKQFIENAIHFTSLFSKKIIWKLFVPKKAHLKVSSSNSQIKKLVQNVFNSIGKEVEIYDESEPGQCRLVLYVEHLFRLWPVALWARDFELEQVVGSKNKKSAVLIHSYCLSMERMCAFVLNNEHVPFWLLPEQVRILLPPSKNEDFVKKVCTLLRAHGIRYTIQEVEHENSTDKFKLCLEQKVPLCMVLGTREAEKEQIYMRDMRFLLKKVENWYSLLSCIELINEMREMSLSC